ncbi:MAG: bifunctional diaminohydroxyphosphoribosylaminopyrimidine deaminase/5-amino-6-(5-phosphoribosylamino)uracil reductase RibD [Methylacidiphilales bacterium]|nr:bifunctional diaminohydroxyphosphoribosylaminopyrimidine deaminase/5-amino-6-(5-phosphoribosylamino)uracil reductase RibD [Candidatus Methylacidiphilales bacterium]
MQKAISVASRGMYTTKPNPRVGCLLVKNNVIISYGFHERKGHLHAEKMALINASETKDTTMYCTLEPCNHYGLTPPCTKEILNSNISRLVIGSIDPTSHINGKGIREIQQGGVEVLVGVEQEACNEINRGFIKRISSNLPWVMAKIAISQDNCYSFINSSRKWISSQPSRKHAHLLRARSCAVVTGYKTFLGDLPKLNARINAPTIQPLIIILDPKKIISESHNYFSTNRAYRIFCGSSQVSERKSNTVTSLPINAKGRFNLREVLQELAKLECNEVLFECGPSLISQLIQENLLDQLFVYRSNESICSYNGVRCDELMQVMRSSQFKLKYYETKNYIGPSDTLSVYRVNNT